MPSGRLAKDFTEAALEVQPQILKRGECKSTFLVNSYY